MNTETKLIKTKLGLLQLAEKLGNVSQACKLFGYCRDSFYRIKERTIQEVNQPYLRSPVASPLLKTELLLKLKKLL